MNGSTRLLDNTLAFKCKKPEELNLFDKFIMFATNSRYSSVELMVNNKWLSFDNNKIKIKPVHELYGYYDYVHIGIKEISDDIAYDVYQFVLKQEMKRINNFYKFFINFLRIRLYTKNSWWDSELVCLILKRLGVSEVMELDPHLTLPGDLAKVFNLE